MGEGSGGGGAVIALLLLWVAGVAFVMVNRDPDGPTTVVEASPASQVTSGASASSDVADYSLDCESAGNCDEPVTRGETAGALSAAFGLPATSEDFFADDDGTEFEDAINRLAALSVTGGCAEAQYCPDTVMQRAPLATFLGRLLSLPDPGEDHFDDDQGSPHEAAINAIAANGITDGCGVRLYCPDAPVTRGQLRAFIEGALAVSP